MAPCTRLARGGGPSRWHAQPQPCRRRHDGAKVGGDEAYPPHRGRARGANLPHWGDETMMSLGCGADIRQAGSAVSFRRGALCSFDWLE